MTTTATDIQVDLLEPQADFLESQAREVLYSGAFGAGKTRAVCYKLLVRALQPGAREGLCRKNLNSLKLTTLKTLLEPDGDLPAVIPEGAFKHNKSERTIRIIGGGEIVYFGLGDAEDYQKIGSLNLSGCGVDEAVELTESDWTMIRGRIRLKAGNLTNQIYGACNPGAPSHFLAARFGLAGGHTPNPNCQGITTRTTDNFFLPEAYVEDLMTLQGVSKKRYVEGLWAGSEGLVFDKWDRTVFVQERDEDWDRVVIGQDEGYTNPAALLVIGIDNDGRMHLIDEWYRRQQLESEVIKQAKDWHDRYGPEVFVIDPSAAKLRAAMSAAGLPAGAADNDVFPGIQAVQARLVVSGDGRPRLTVSPRCVETIREFESYEWRTQRDGYARDEPVKQNDHAMDALRYAIVHVDGFRVVPRFRRLERAAAPLQPGAISAEAEERMWHTV